MPRIVMDIQQTYDNITRPVALQIAERLAYVLRLPTDTTILMPDVAEKALFPNSAIGESDPRDPTSFGHGGRLMIEVEENPVEAMVLPTAVHQIDQREIFTDQQLGIRMWPVKNPMEMRFNLTYRAPNRTLVRQFRNEVLNRTAALREGILHELQYYYHIPAVAQKLLAHLFDLRQDIAGYPDDTFDKWLTEQLTINQTVLTNQIGTVDALAVAETQIMNLGHFEFLATTDREEVEKRSGTWQVSFSYTITYDQISQLLMDYPLQVHQGLVDELWRATPHASGYLVDPDRRLRTQTYSREAADYFTPVFTNHCKKIMHNGLVLPEYDDWQPEHVTPNTSTLFTLMLGIDPTAPLTLFNLLDDDLYGYQVSETLREFLKGEAPYISYKSLSIFDLRLYQNGYPMDDGCVIMDEQMNITANVQFDLRQRYHIRLSLVNDLFSLTAEAQQRLREGGAVAVDILNMLQWKTLGVAFTPTLVGGRLIRREDLTTIAQRINDRKVAHRGPLEYNILTVMDTVIHTHRSNNVGSNQTQTYGPDVGGTGQAGDSFTNPAPCGS